MRTLITRLVLLVLTTLSLGVLAPLLAAAQIWQIGGYPLPLLNQLEGVDGPLPTVNPARQDPGVWAAGVQWQFQNGDPRRTTVEPVPRNSALLPLSAGAQGGWHELRWRGTFQQLYNSHEESPDSSGTWQDFDARLEALGVQLALPLQLGRWGLPDVVVGAGWQRYRLVADQVLAWTSGSGDDAVDYQIDLNRKLLADGLEAGVDMVYHQARLGLSWRQETTWNHWDNETLNPDSTASVQVWGVLPQQWSLQLDVDTRPGWSVTGQLQWTEWSAAQLSLKDQLDFGLVVHGTLPGRWGRFQGGFTTARTGSSVVDSWGDDYSSWFLLAGVEKDLPRGVTASLKVADSHLGGADARKQVLVQAGLRVQLGRR